MCIEASQGPSKCQCLETIWLQLYVCVCVSCSVVSDSVTPTDCSPPGFSLRGILQARILEWVAIFSPGDLPNPGIEPGNGTLLQYSCLENPMDGRAWWAAVHGVTKSRTRLSDFTLTFHFHALEKEMATLSSVLFWRIPGTGEPGGLPSMGSHRIGHN